MNFRIHRKVSEGVLSPAPRLFHGRYLQGATKFLCLALLTAGAHSNSVGKDVKNFQGFEETINFNSHHIEEGNTVIDLKDGPEVRKLATNELVARVNASSAQNGRNFAPERAIDGRIGSQWKSKAGDVQNFQFQFNEVQNVKCIRIYFGGTCPIKYIISTKGSMKSEWTKFKIIDQEARGKKPNSLCGRNQKVTVPKVRKVRYINIRTSKTDRKRGISIRAIKVSSDGDC